MSARIIILRIYRHTKGFNGIKIGLLQFRIGPIQLVIFRVDQGMEKGVVDCRCGLVGIDTQKLYFILIIFTFNVNDPHGLVVLVHERENDSCIHAFNLLHASRISDSFHQIVVKNGHKMLNSAIVLADSLVYAALCITDFESVIYKNEGVFATDKVH